MNNLEITNAIIKSFDIGFLTGISVASFVVLNIILIHFINEWSEKKKENKKNEEE